MAKKSVYLAEEVIKEILLRLPVKSVLRCKCVCKLWLSIISHPHFAISHFQLAASPTHRIMSVKIYGFKKANAHEALSIDFNASLNDDSAYHSLSLDFLPRAYPPDIRGSCRGFLLLDCYYCLYLWNPSTGVNKHIPLSPMIIADNDAHFVHITFLYGFGYDRSTDDYIVVVGGSYNKKYMVSSSIDLEIFSMRGSEWEQIELDSDLPYRNTASSEGIVRVGSFLNGSIHWLVYNYETKKNVIIAFDLKEMTLSEIALPDDFYSDYSPRIYDLLLFGGLISVLNVKRSKIKIWVMQEYAVHSSWTKTFDFSFHPDPEFSPLCFTNCGDIVGPANGGLVKLNDKGQLLKYHSHSYRYFMRSQMAVYTESLLSLPDGTEQA